jgi:hypothetical protein
MPSFSIFVSSRQVYQDQPFIFISKSVSSDSIIGIKLSIGNHLMMGSTILYLLSSGNKG